MAGRTRGASRGAVRRARNIALRPIRVRDEMKLYEGWYAFCVAPRRKRAPDGSGSLPPVVLAEEDLDATPRGLDGVGMRPGVKIDELDAVVNGAVRVTL